MKILSGLVLAIASFAVAAQAHLDVQTVVQKQEVFVNDNGESETRMVTADVVVPETFTAAEQLTVSEDGETRAAKASDYTHVRWVLKNNLAAGAQATARFAAVLE